MKGIFFIGILLVMGYFLYTFYGKQTGMSESGAVKNITDAPQIFKQKAEDAVKSQVDKMQRNMDEALGEN